MYTYISFTIGTAAVAGRRCGLESWTSSRFFRLGRLATCGICYHHLLYLCPNME